MSFLTTRKRLAPAALVTGVLAAGLLSLSMTGTLSGFVASITNPTNTSSAGSLAMEESYDKSPLAEYEVDYQAPTNCFSTVGGVTTANHAECSSINKFGGSTHMAPGHAITTNVSIHNTGTLTPDTFTLTPGAKCQASEALPVQHGIGIDTMCEQVSILIKSGDKEIFSGTAAQLESHAPFELSTLPAAGESIPFTFVTTLSSDASNDYQGLGVSLPLTWTFAI